MPEVPSGTVTFLFTDIAGSTVRWTQHSAAMRAARRPFHEAQAEQAGGHAQRGIGQEGRPAP